MYLKTVLSVLMLVGFSVSIGATLTARTDLQRFIPTAPALPRPSSTLEFYMTNYGAWSNGEKDETEAFQKCFTEVAEAGGGIVVIAPRTYYLSGSSPIKLPSNTKVVATGARFILPKVMGDRAKLLLFEGVNVHDFTWEGGRFEGYCFDINAASNTWEPNANTGIFRFRTTPQGTTARLLFKGIESSRIAGAVISVNGIPRAGSESEVELYARDISVLDCRFVDSGSFMWDYGYLWQVMTWPQEHTAREREVADRYFPKHLVREGGRFEAGGSRFFLDNRDAVFAVAKDSSAESAITFFGDKLPAVIKRGKAYYVVNATSDSIEVAEKMGGVPLRYTEKQDMPAGVIRDMAASFWQLMSPTGGADSKGAIDLRQCLNTRISGCTLSAQGDTTHLLRCRENYFGNNKLTGSRMGSLFLGEFCQRSLVENNTVDGTNGSRALSVEKSNVDTVIRKNFFKGAGRGTWINQPENILIDGNTFINNTTKGEKNEARGRRTFLSGGFEAHSEIYFTLYQPAGRYSSVTIRGNRFTTGPEAIRALAFLANGSDILVENNIFEGPVRSIEVNETCVNVTIRSNVGSTVLKQASK